MSFWDFLNQWWNLPYLVALGLVGVFFVLQALGFAAHAVSPEHDLDLDGDGAADHDAGGEGAAEHDVGGDSDAEHDWSVASLLGAGRVPFMVVWLTLFIFFGFTGLIANRLLLASRGSYSGWYFPLSLGAALVIGVVAVRFASRAVQKLVDVGGPGASSRRDLRGRVGKVASARLDAEFGEVRVHDVRGHELIVHGKLASGEEPLGQGADVVLIDLEQNSGFFTVAALKR